MEEEEDESAAAAAAATAAVRVMLVSLLLMLLLLLVSIPHMPVTCTRTAAESLRRSSSAAHASCSSPNTGNILMDVGTGKKKGSG